MLAPEDLNIIERDNGLPQLGRLLDPLHYTSLIASHYASCFEENKLTDLQLTYLRYKPGVNCVAGYAFKSGTQSRLAYAKIFSPGQAEKRTLVY